VGINGKGNGRKDGEKEKREKGMGEGKGGKGKGRGEGKEKAFSSTMKSGIHHWIRLHFVSTSQLSDVHISLSYIGDS